MIIISLACYPCGLIRQLLKKFLQKCLCRHSHHVRINVSSSQRTSLKENLYFTMDPLSTSSYNYLGRWRRVFTLKRKKEVAQFLGFYPDFTNRLLATCNYLKFLTISTSFSFLCLSFSHSVFTEHLLCARHCWSMWGPISALRCLSGSFLCMHRH